MKTKIPFNYLSMSLLMAAIMAILPMADAGASGVVVSQSSQPFTLLTSSPTTNSFSSATSSSAENAQAKPNLVAECAVAIVVIVVFTNTVSAGQTINVEDDDAPAQAGFYRVMLQAN